MLVNLTPSRRYRSEMGMHKRRLRHWDYSREEVKRINFNYIFQPTGYTGVYYSTGDENTINAWCKQNATLYKFYRKMKKLMKSGAIDEEINNIRENAWDFGVADDIQQVLGYYADRDPEIYKGNHVIFINTVKRNPNAPCCGWRWHKWGKYIGTQNPQCEYLNDETDIEEVVCFSIYKVV